MSVTIETKGESFGKWINTRIEGKERQIEAVLEKAGLDCLSEARRNGKYTDRTGNLRSSTGYAVVIKGKVVNKSNFAKVPGQSGIKNTGNGPLTGRELLDNLCSEESGTALIFVAGMNYAKYVEARQYNVLESAYALAKRQIKSNLNMIFKDQEK
jgi:hypothetical protein